ncbi:MAG TPA: S-layer homology domain-containing protein, partial [Thermoanaerobaculia bacterium]
SHVFFAANDSATGFEPWAVPRAAVLNTFSDVAADFWAWPFVEALAAAGLTTGCAAGQFCPETSVSRAETAAFLVRGIHGPGFVPPPATGTVFQDVPADYWAASWIEQIFQDGLTSGCASAPPRFCPEQPLTRAEMAVFLLRAKHGGAYTPPAATGTVFSDVPAGDWAASWIEQLAAEGITTGCAPGLYCPEAPVSRAQMAAFLTRTFSLPLP